MLDRMYDARSWYWQVAGRTDYWSSASAAYVQDLPESQPFTPIASEEELSDVLRPYGLRGPVIANEDVNAERQRRVVAGKTINGVAVTGRDEDARNLTNLALAAQLRIGSGDTTTTTTFRDGNNVDHDLTPPQMLALWQASAAYVSALYEASWALKAMDPIPVDYADATHWPAV
jgi:hypothetical protein